MVPSQHVRCPGCGRSYDVDAFPLGRTLHCTCGRRVGLERPLRISVPDDRPRFIADAMLGKLARWLRTLGYDTAYDDAIADADLIRRAVKGGRLILTRDRRLFEEWRVEGGHVLESDGVEAQLREVARAFDLPRPARLFTRCRECNAELEPVELPAVAGDLPPRVRRRLRRREARGGASADALLARCPVCERIYWPGSHTDRMRALVDRVFGRS